MRPLTLAPVREPHECHTNALIRTENFQRFVNHMGGQKVVPWLMLNHEASTF
jgi:hypothetical protein